MWGRGFMVTYFMLMTALWLAAVWFFLFGPRVPSIFEMLP
jgi:hypothetical protein